MSINDLTDALLEIESGVFEIVDLRDLGQDLADAPIAEDFSTSCSDACSTSSTSCSWSCGT
jgi:hypothetical protein